MAVHLKINVVLKLLGINNILVFFCFVFLIFLSDQICNQNERFVKICYLGYIVYILHKHCLSLKVNFRDSNQRRRKDFSDLSGT